MLNFIKPGLGVSQRGNGEGFYDYYTTPAITAVLYLNIHLFLALSSRLWLYLYRWLMKNRIDVHKKDRGEKDLFSFTYPKSFPRSSISPQDFSSSNCRLRCMCPGGRNFPLSFYILLADRRAKSTWDWSTGESQTEV